jgi:hypothetical protein
MESSPERKLTEERAGAFTDRDFAGVDEERIDAQSASLLGRSDNCDFRLFLHRTLIVE